LALGAALPAETAHFGDRHSLNAGRGERVLDFFQLVMADNRFNLFHSSQLRIE